MEDFVRENQAEDQRCLATVEEQIENQEKAGIPVAGIIVEPIQAEGGDNHGSKEFFQVILQPQTLKYVYYTGSDRKEIQNQKWIWTSFYL